MQVPRKLFKYRSLASESQLNFVRRLLCEHEIYFASPSSLNDPGEMMWEYDFSMPNTLTRLTGWISRLVARRSGRLLTPSPLSWSSRIRPRSAQKEKMMTVVRQKMDEWFGVFSTTEDPLGMEMWSYYADDHRGLCVQFDTAHLIESYREGRGLANTPIPVKYVTGVPAIKCYIEPVEIQLEKALFVKSSHWAHEREWRFIATYNSANPDSTSWRVVRLRPGSVDAVYLGCRMSPEHRAMVDGWLRSYGLSSIRLVSLRKEGYSLRPYNEETLG